MRRAAKAAVLFLIGGGVYSVLELAWRGHSHWTMFVLGGVCFLLLGGINELLPWDLGLVVQSLIGAGGVTLAEFLAGLVLNVWLGLGVWDYSGLWGNVLGQICPQYAAAWLAIAPIAIVLDDLLRWRLFGEQKPRYTAL